MNIAIISDSHDNIPNIEKFIKWANGNNAGAVIHCGDICAPSIIKNFLGPKLNCPVHLIHGNVSDRELLAKVSEQFKNVTLHGDFGEVKLGGKKVAFAHYPNQAKELAELGKYDLVFYGHNHQPWDEVVGKTRMLNPGTLAGMFNRATFAVYETGTGKAELMLLEKL